MQSPVSVLITCLPALSPGPPTPLIPSKDCHTTLVTNCTAQEDPDFSPLAEQKLAFWVVTASLGPWERPLLARFLLLSSQLSGLASSVPQAGCISWTQVGVPGGASCGVVESEALREMRSGAPQIKYSFLLLSPASWRDGSSCRAASALSANSVPLASLVWYVPLCRYM